MTTTKRYLVGVFGVPELERQVLDRIFSLSATRANAYQTVIEPEAASVDIFLVDRQNPAAVEKMRKTAGKASGIPTVGIIRENQSKEPYTVRRPFTATRMLGVLDLVVEKEIPAAASSREAPVPSSSPAPPAPANPASTGEMAKEDLNPGYRALVVDDSLPVRKQVALALKRSGIVADFADNGEAALDLIAEKNYDIIFLDVIMPGVDGYEVCKAIKRDKMKKNIPVIMLTGKSSPFDKVKGKLSGCDTYLIKPVSIRAFNEALNKCLQQPMAFESMAGLN